jgi:hypothetical protein
MVTDDRSRLSQVMSVRVRHILVSTKEMADDLLTQLKANADFEELARAISGCEFTRESGGEVRNTNTSQTAMKALIGSRPSHATGIFEWWGLDVVF